MPFATILTGMVSKFDNLNGTIRLNVLQRLANAGDIADVLPVLI